MPTLQMLPEGLLYVCGTKEFVDTVEEAVSFHRAHRSERATGGAG
jgi:hypothetical protein